MYRRTSRDRLSLWSRAAVLGVQNLGYWGGGWLAGRVAFERDRKLTLDMKRPKAPPSTKPIPPAITAFVGHDSIAACICSSIVNGVVGGGGAELYVRFLPWPALDHSCLLPQTREAFPGNSWRLAHLLASCRFGTSSAGLKHGGEQEISTVACLLTWCTSLRSSKPIVNLAHCTERESQSVGTVTIAA